MGWTTQDLPVRRKSDPEKPALAGRLGTETILSISRMAVRLHFGSAKSAKAQLASWTWMKANTRPSAQPPAETANSDRKREFDTPVDASIFPSGPSLKSVGARFLRVQRHGTLIHTDNRANITLWERRLLLCRLGQEEARGFHLEMQVTRGQNVNSKDKDLHGKRHDRPTALAPRMLPSSRSNIESYSIQSYE